MTAGPLTTLVMPCAADAACTGDMYLRDDVYWCTRDSYHAVHIDGLAACTECDVPQQSDRVTIPRALREGWVLIDGKGMVCGEHTRSCDWCSEPYWVEQTGACQHQCRSCNGDRACDECARDAYYDRQESMARDGDL